MAEHLINFDKQSSGLGGITRETFKAFYMRRHGMKDWHHDNERYETTLNRFMDTMAEYMDMYLNA